MGQAKDAEVQLPLEPFRCLPLLNSHNSWKSRRLLFLLPLLFTAAAVASILEGTFGTLKDFSPGADFRRVFGIGNPEPSPSRFPFMRDYPSWFLASVIVLTCVLVHRQWRLMYECLPKLVENGVLIPKGQAAWSSLQRRLGMDRLISPYPSNGRAAATPFGAFVAALNHRWFGLVARANVLFFAAAALIVGLVILNIQRNGLFEVLAPTGQDLASRKDWLTTTYDSWWASTKHPLGISVYAAAATLAVFVVLLQNAVGMACIYLGVAMPALVDFSADWDDPGRCYGWSPLARMYRTVYWSLMLHGGTLTMLLVVLGGDNFRWLGGLVLLWSLVLPLYIVVPWLVFRRVRNSAARVRIGEIDLSLQNDLDRSDLSDTQKDDCREMARKHKMSVESARITPLRLSRLQVPAFVVTVLFPIVLQVLGMWFSLRFGTE